MHVEYTRLGNAVTAGEVRLGCCVEGGRKLGLQPSQSTRIEVSLESQLRATAIITSMAQGGSLHSLTQFLEK